MPTPAAPKPQCQPTFSPSVPQMSGEMITGDLDAEIVDLKAVGAARIVDGIKIAHLRGDIALEAADAEQKAEQCRAGSCIERHQEMAQPPSGRAPMVTVAVRPISGPRYRPPAMRRQIHEARVEADRSRRPAPARQRLP